jgi:hypothetical protein
VCTIYIVREKCRRMVPQFLNGSTVRRKPKEARVDSTCTKFQRLLHFYHDHVPSLLILYFAHYLTCVCLGVKEISKTSVPAADTTYRR